MIDKHLKFIIFCFLSACFNLSDVIAQDDLNERHTLVAIRMMGHQILLNSGDSTSLVLGIQKENERHRLQFENELRIYPQALVETIDSVVAKSGIAESYLVEVEECASGSVVYSYEIGNSVKKDLIPCIKRELPKACYTIYFTVLGTNSSLQSDFTKASNKRNDKDSSNWGAVDIFSITMGTALLIGIIVLWVYFQKKRSNLVTHEDIVQIGAYQFSRKNLELTFKNETIDLSCKEADLLWLLLNASNSTVERDYLLKKVWGDEGNYIGRTLDVFISKLRKKLDGDSTVKIVNVRGVGYKLIL